MTSGSCRSPYFRPSAKVKTSSPTSRWVTTESGLRKEIFYRLFHRDDAVPARLVQQVDEDRHGGRFARTGGPRKDDQAVLHKGQAFGQVRGKSRPGEIRNDRRHDPQAAAHLSSAVEQIGTEALDLAIQHHFERQIDVLQSLQPSQGLGRAQRTENGPRFLFFQARFQKLDQVPVQAQHGRIAGNEVKVRGPRLDGVLQPLAKLVRNCLPFAMTFAHETSSSIHYSPRAGVFHRIGEREKNHRPSSP